MRLRLFSDRRDAESGACPRLRYVSELQRDVRRYQGWTHDMVESDYHASKYVHTILTLGYLEYDGDVLILTDRGMMLMQNVPEIIPMAGEAGANRS